MWPVQSVRGSVCDVRVNKDCECFCNILDTNRVWPSLFPLSCTVVTPTRRVDLAPSTLLFVNAGAMQPSVQTRPVQCYHVFQTHPVGVLRPVPFTTCSIHATFVVPRCSSVRPAAGLFFCQKFVLHCTGNHFEQPPMEHSRSWKAKVAHPRISGL